MKLKKILNYTWYITKVIIVDDIGNEVNIEKIKKRAFFVGESYKIGSETTKWLLNKDVRSFGVIDDYFIIEIYNNIY